MELCKACDGSQQSCCKSCFHAIKAGRCTTLHGRWQLSKVLLLVFLQKLVGWGGGNASPGSCTAWYACIKCCSQCHHRRPAKIQPFCVTLCCIRRDVPTDLQCLLHCQGVNLPPQQVHAATQPALLRIQLALSSQQHTLLLLSTSLLVATGVLQLTQLALQSVNGECESQMLLCLYVYLGLQSRATS